MYPCMIFLDAGCLKEWFQSIICSLVYQCISLVWPSNIVPAIILAFPTGIESMQIKVFQHTFKAFYCSFPFHPTWNNRDIPTEAIRKPGNIFIKQWFLGTGQKITQDCDLLKKRNKVRSLIALFRKDTIREQGAC